MPEERNERTTETNKIANAHAPKPTKQGNAAAVCKSHGNCVTQQRVEKRHRKAKTTNEAKQKPTARKRPDPTAEETLPPSMQKEARQQYENENE